MARSSNEGTSGPLWLMFFFVLLGGSALAWRYWPAGGLIPANDPNAQPRPVTPAGPPTSEEEKRIDIFSKAKAAVVNITSAQYQRNRFTLDIQQIPQSTGTGFIWDDQGRIVTNYHVIEGADGIRVTMDDHSTWNVVKKSYDANYDLAVLWVDIPKIKSIPLPVGESSKLQVGQGVLAIGNPFGLDHSLSNGIIAALGREMKTEKGHTSRGLIQTTAAINPGNSGGPLLDNSGRLIGVNSAILSPSGAFAGIGFAIPVDVVNRVVPGLIRGTKEGRPGLGIVEAPDQWARQRGIDGVLIINVMPGSPAAKAGLRPTRRDEDTGDIQWGDIIVGIDDRPIHSAKQMYDMLEKNYQIGQEVTLHILRDEEKKDVKLTLAADYR